MRKFLVAVLMVFSSAVFADEPANVTQFRADVLQGFKDQGVDPGECEIKMIDKYEDEKGVYPILTIKCSKQPFVCIFALYPNEPLFVMDSVECVSNPEFIEPEKLDKL